MRRIHHSRVLSTARSTVVLTALAAVVLAAGIPAQERPNFTGVWAVSAQHAGPTAATAGPTVTLGSGWGERFTLIQDAEMLTVERLLYWPRDFQPMLKVRYSLDGSESRNTFMMGRGIQVQDSTVAWENGTLVIKMVYAVPNVEDGETVPCETTQALSLQPPREASGESSLVIETVRCGILGGLPSSTRTVYVRR